MHECTHTRTHTHTHAHTLRRVCTLLSCLFVITLGSVSSVPVNQACILLSPKLIAAVTVLQSQAGICVQSSGWVYSLETVWRSQGGGGLPCENRIIHCWPKCVRAHTHTHKHPTPFFAQSQLLGHPTRFYSVCLLSFLWACMEAAAWPLGLTVSQFLATPVLLLPAAPHTRPGPPRP